MGNNVKLQMYKTLLLDQLNESKILKKTMTYNEREKFKAFINKLTLEQAEVIFKDEDDNDEEVPEEQESISWGVAKEREKLKSQGRLEPRHLPSYAQQRIQAKPSYYQGRDVPRKSHDY